MIPAGIDSDTVHTALELAASGATSVRTRGDSLDLDPGDGDIELSPGPPWPAVRPEMKIGAGGPLTSRYSDLRGRN